GASPQGGRGPTPHKCRWASMSPGTRDISPRSSKVSPGSWPPAECSVVGPAGASTGRSWSRGTSARMWLPSTNTSTPAKGGPSPVHTACARTRYLARCCTALGPPPAASSQSQKPRQEQGKVGHVRHNEQHQDYHREERQRRGEHLLCGP